VPDAGNPGGTVVSVDDVVNGFLYSNLFDAAEHARWSMTDIKWDSIDRSVVTPELCEYVREAAYAELTTASATRRFLTELSDDTDFTQWISIWFYEETKHPQALLRWLSRVGVTFDESTMRRGRAAAPFMRSRMGTLVTNIVSEMVASETYMDYSRRCPEPVLAQITRNLGADEARHAAGFYAYARRHLERAASSRDREADCRDALKVLYAWFEDNSNVRHPVNEFQLRRGEDHAMVAQRDRIFALIGTLIDRPLASTADVLAALGQQTVTEERAR
jgi:hypothetical protein